MMALAAGLPTIFRDREDVRPEGETSLGMRQVLAAPTTSRLRGPPSGGPVTHNGEGPLRITEGLHPPFHPAASLPAAVQRWRSRISCATTGRRGVLPTELCRYPL